MDHTDTSDLDDNYEFYLCLTHDVDRVRKLYQGPYYVVKHRDPRYLYSSLRRANPYWQFENIMELEDDLGVRSSFYFLNEQRLFSDKPPTAWLKPRNWILFVGRYDIQSPKIRRVIDALDEGGWEVGLHGSYESFNDLERLRTEKRVLDRILGKAVTGGRQHYLNLERPTTWEYHRSIGLHYDASLGSSSEYGFNHGYQPLHPFDDEFTVFPLTIMEHALMRDVSFPEAWARCEDLLKEANRHQAVMTILWHQNVFSEEEFPGYREMYRRIIQRALDMGAWVGPCGELLHSFIRGG